ncbi:hypothetical protein OG978_43855 (plasmid) [Streptomyces sp. NBC_01591]|uniref:hypothetical protein n=1 Tax=Streptomyces sp. NBC_01591 TaxID=2975888 RepID=UPI002DDB9F44|nr:hypothetical protein [Streptomyces sp. NBC_01591]WSD74082.1 hypothetical protein OG978_43855 [Streptomyces sp. NBC_01591]
MSSSKPPGIYARESSAGMRVIVGVGTSTPAFLGYTKVSAKGDPTPSTPPFTEDERKHPQLVRGWQEFTDRYSVKGIAEELAEATDPAAIRALERCFPLAEAVYGFFANGGTSCYVVGFTSPQSAVGDVLRGQRLSM